VELESAGSSPNMLRIRTRNGEDVGVDSDVHVAVSASRSTAGALAFRASAPRQIFSTSSTR